jgi:hypothetical protein
MLLQTSEKRPDGLSIYWLADKQTGERVCGIAFEDGRLNIHNQEIVESLVFALAWAEQDYGKWFDPEKYKGKAGGE